MVSCGFATTVWEKDWKKVLLTPDFLKVHFIENHQYDFQDRLLVINNVEDKESVKKAASILIDQGVLTRFVVVDEIVDEMMSFFCLTKKDFETKLPRQKSTDWLYYNATGPLCAIYAGSTDYLLYHTGDVWLDKKTSWIERSLSIMEKKSNVQVANLLWNYEYDQAKKESYKTTWNYFFAKGGFSDQQFLIRRKVFRQPIYSEIREDSHHYPYGDIFEKRVFSFLKNRNFERIIFRRGSYIHENVVG